MLVSRLRIVNPGNSTALCIASPSHENNVASASKTVIRPVWSKHEYVSFPRQRDPRVQYFIDAPLYCTSLVPCREGSGRAAGHPRNQETGELDQRRKILRRNCER